MGKRYDTFFAKVFSSDYRYYFDVDNAYVTKKLAILVAPFLSRVVTSVIYYRERGPAVEEISITLMSLTPHPINIWDTLRPRLTYMHLISIFP